MTGGGEGSGWEGYGERLSRCSVSEKPLGIVFLGYLTELGAWQSNATVLQEWYHTGIALCEL